LLVLIIILLSLFGCGGGGGGSGGDSNASPTANAGPDLNHDEQTLVILDGSGSDGNIVTYLWSQTGGVPVSLNNANSAIANFVAPEVTQDTLLSFRLTVTDDQGASDTDDMGVLVRAVNAPPIANAGPDKFTPGQTLVTLDGTGSSDSDGSIASYTWTEIGGPTVTLNNADTATPSFTAPVSSAVLVFRLTVTDNEGASSNDEVTVNVARQLFSDDFQNANSWNVVDDTGNGPAWQVISAEYYQQNYMAGIVSGNPFEESYHLGTYSWLDHGAFSNNDYRFSVEVTPLPDPGTSNPQGNDIGVMFRYQDGANETYYRFSMSARYGFSRLEKKRSDGTFRTLAVDARGYYENVTLDLTIEVAGPLIQVFVDDESLFSVSDSELTSGTVALYCQDKAKFDNVIVTENNPAPTVVISSPVAYSVVPGNNSTIDVSALVTNVPANASVEFVLDSSTSRVSPNNDNPFTAQFNGVSQGEHVIRAILSDGVGTELSSDTNERIGVSGDYYIAIGNSITNGRGDDDPSDNTSQDGRIIASQGYEANLDDLLTATRIFPHIVFNEGIGGDASGGALSRIDSILERHPNANKALIILGTNDASQLVDPLDYENNMRGLIKKIVDAGKEVWVAFIPFNKSATSEEDQNIQDYNDIIIPGLISGFQIGPDFYAAEEGPDFYTFFEVNQNTLFDPDGLHPNADGHAAMAQEWHDVLRFFP
jgi:lysophospholipase L1-like esterase